MSVLLVLDRKVSFDFYALLNLDRQNDVSWLSVEDEKPSHNDSVEQTQVMLQMSHKWTVENRNLTEDQILGHACRRVG